MRQELSKQPILGMRDKKTTDRNRYRMDGEDDIP